MLGNHTSMMDPFLMSYPVVRIVKMMGSSAMLKTPFLGAWFTRLGVFPKIKYVKDKDSMQTLAKHYEDGYVVSLFPEGNRSWNGQTAQISEGIGRLVKRLDAAVVCVRLPTMYLFHPRWATYPRFIPVEIHFDAATEYPESATAADITADIQKRLDTTPKITGSPWTFGFRMAHGLSDFLWACPSCFSLESLDVSPKNGNVICCSSCSIEWELDVMTVMRSFTPIVEQNIRELTVKEAFERIKDHFQDPPIATQDYEETGIALKTDLAQIISSIKGKKELVAAGKLELSQKGLLIHGQDQKLWDAPWSSLKGISVELGNRLLFRRDGISFELKLEHDSPLKWDYFMRRWRHFVTGSEH